MVAEEETCLHRCSDMEDRVERTVLDRHTLHGISLAEVSLFSNQKDPPCKIERQ